MSIWKKRIELKPIIYPEAVDIIEKINHTYWLHSELTFNSDPMEINNLKPYEKEAIVRSLLLISTIEVQVKEFWGQLGNFFPHPEWAMLGATLAENEVRHTFAYSRLLSLLNLDDRFKDIFDVPCVKGRFEYLKKYLSIPSNESDKKKIITKLILFSVLIENVSLFSQFCTILYFYRHKGIIKDVSNIIAWTSLEEVQHFNTGSTLVNILRKENPELFDEDLEKTILAACKKSVKYESNILDWVFEEKELDKLSKKDLLDFMKERVDESLVSMGFKKVFNENLNLDNTRFFIEEVFGDSLDDFFARRPVDYTLNDISITEEDLF